MIAAASNVIALRPEPVTELHAPIELRRSFDAADINPILNDPAVFPAIAIPGIEKFDVSNLLADPGNVLLTVTGGSVLFCQQEPGIYEVHTNFLPAHRGRHAIRASLAAYRWMFTHTDCMVLLTRVPAPNLAARKFCKIVGATLEFVRQSAWPTPTGNVALHFFALRYDDWVRKTPDLIVSGQQFHAQLEQERVRHNHPIPIHVDEECHNLHVGACAEMIYGGQPEKAVVLYNRWARFVGFNCYKPIALVARSPLVIDITQALLQILDGTFKVIQWR